VTSLQIGFLGIAAVLVLLALRVPIAAELPMADAEAAYDRFAAGGKLGKVVLITA